ncbi:Nif3-like dinuclear metal center hexameric protein [Mesonia sp. K7]|uniref:Nif3-like dinuclear metal center hexameric protein n=1 Tax=Mesonia sp. K7 TaxID=2218606 RepID=UPI000DA9BCBB|nr:Nif3-like dinuclear metal center hexameric protein [Mesonia sp. K7]PZD76777.1 Nif3-like dinuclear metal center hexameric protein [Mesonia sp. K7]
MQIKEVIDTLEEMAPLAYAEDFDNVGLLVGDKNAEITGVLVTLDTLEVTIDEAIENNCNLIIAFHPIVFSGLKKITGKTYVERVVLKAIQNNIAIYSIHTALDNYFRGVNHQICEKLGLQHRKVLLPQKSTIKKLTTYVPIENSTLVKQALFEAGAGSIGNYENCSFTVEGIGSFKGNEASNPVIGEKGKLQEEKEIQLNITFAKHLEPKIVKALFEAHPYEEVAYEITSLDNYNQKIGIGMIGELTEAIDTHTFLQQVKKTFKCGVIRHSALVKEKVKKVAVLGGSGAFAINQAIRESADIYLTSDLKYHDFYKAEDKIVLADIGHYESEQYTKNLLHEFLTKKFSSFAIILSQKNTNPIQYS